MPDSDSKINKMEALGHNELPAKTGACASDRVRPLSFSEEVARGVAEAKDIEAEIKALERLASCPEMGRPLEDAQDGTPVSEAKSRESVFRYAPLKIAFAGGGTGGHLYPALAVAEVLKREYQAQMLFFDSKQGVGRSIVRNLGYNLRTIYAQGLGGNLLDKLLAVAKLAIGFGQSLYYLSRFSPHVVVASGGYVCVPVALAAYFLNIPVLLMEQNAFAGKSANLIAQVADKVCISLPGSYPKINQEKLVLTGNPVRQAIISKDKAQARCQLDIPDGQLCVAVVGGSQGAVSLNRAVLAALPEWAEHKFTLIHLTGEKHIDEVMCRSRELVRDKAIDYRPMAYTEDMASLYAAADAVVCRSGATTLAEIAARGLPSILVPYPYAAENHQEANARVLEEHGAAVVITDNQIEEKLCGSLLDFVGDKERLAERAAKAKLLGHPQASSLVVAEIMRLVENKRNIPIR